MTESKTAEKDAQADNETMMKEFCRETGCRFEIALGYRSSQSRHRKVFVRFV